MTLQSRPAPSPDRIWSGLHALLSNMLKAKGFAFRPDKPLRDQLDSLEMFVLLAELETTFDIDIEETDVVDANFRTIDTLATFVTRKLRLPFSGALPH
jgi:hypothetical protein